MKKEVDSKMRKMKTEQELYLNEIKKIQIEEIKLINAFKKICEKEHLSYFMIGGTMLGAIRHKGYIPWDDDADFAMPREDYEKLLQKAPAYLQEPYQLENFLFDNNYIYYHTKLSTSRLKIEIPGRIKNQMENVGIDILPFDGMPDNKLLFSLHQFRVLAKRALYAFSVFDEKVLINYEYRSGIQKILIFIGRYFKIGKLFSLKKQWFAFDKALKKYSVYQSRWMIHGMGWIMRGMGYKDKDFKGIRDIYKKEIFGEGAFYEFEGMQLRGPKDYKAYLSQHFGNDYMTLPPESERKGHEFRIIENEDSTN